MQKNLGKKKSSGGRKNAANKHGKGGRVTKKGKLEKPIKRARLKQSAVEETRITKIINMQNEDTFAGVASNAGGKLSVLKAPLPVDSRSKSLKKKGSAPWGASSK